MVEILTESSRMGRIWIWEGREKAHHRLRIGAGTKVQRQLLGRYRMWNRKRLVEIGMYDK